MRGREAWQLRLQSAAVTIAVVAAGGVVQYYLALAGEGDRSRRLTYEVCRRYMISIMHTFVSLDITKSKVPGAQGICLQL